MRARRWMMAGALAAACLLPACSKKTEPDEARSAASAEKPPPSAPARAAERWRVRVAANERGDIVARAALGLADGGALVAWELTAPVTLPLRSEPFTPVEGADVLITRVGADGQLTSAEQISGRGAQEVEGLALAGTTPVLALRSSDALTIAGTALAPPQGKDEFSWPWLGALVTLDDTGAARSARPLPADADLAIAGLPGGEVVIAASYAQEDGSHFGRALVQRLGDAGEPRWSVELPAVAVNALSVLDGEIAAATRSREGLGVQLIAADSGEHRPVARVPKYPAGDLGTVAGVLRHGGDLLVYGETGREGVMRDGTLYSHSIEPFVLRAGGKGGDAAKESLADVVGSVAAVGKLGGEPVAVIHVIHDMALYGGRALPHRGVYLALGAGEPRFLPVVQVDYENDEHPYGQKTAVHGEPLSLWSAAFAGDAVLLLGTCDDEERVGCVAKVELAAQ